MRPLALLPATLLAACSATPLPTQGWLSDADVDAPPLLQSDALRGRVARVDVPFVDGAGTPAAFETASVRTLPLFQDLVLEAELDHLTQSGGATVWTGHIAGWPEHEVVLSRTRDGHVSGFVRAPEALVRLRPLGPGRVVVEEVATRLGDADLQPRVPLGLPVGDAASWDPSAADAGSPVIDVLVVSTTLTSSTLGGESGVRSAAEALVAQANKGYADSGLDVRLRLAGVHLSTWDEDGFAWSDTLYGLMDEDDGLLDDVPPAREAVGADVVSVLVDGDGGACGLGFLMSPARPAFEAAAYSAVDLRCAGPNLSFTHEIGHNLGLQHDRDNAGSTPATDHAYGYQDPDATFRTVMAYDCEGARCPRLNLWSNPDHAVDGAPAGVAIASEDAAHNVASIGITAPVVAGFRDPVNETEAEAATLIAPASGSVVSGSTVAVAWTDVSADSYVITVGSTPGGADLARVDAGSATSTVVSGLPTDGSTLHTTLWSTFGDESVTSAGTWVAAAPPPKVASLDSPTPGSMLDGTRVTFAWDDVGADGYALVLGSSRFGSDLGTFATSATELSVSGLPDDGRTLWVSLYSQDGSRWRSETVTYKAFDADLDLLAPAHVLEPAPGGTLSTRTLTFRWTDPGASAYALTLWSGETEVYHEIVSGTAATVELPSTVPAGPLTVRLATQLGGRWFSREYSYVLE